MLSHVFQHTLSLIILYLITCIEFLFTNIHRHAVKLDIQGFHSNFSNPLRTMSDLSCKYWWTDCPDWFVANGRATLLAKAINLLSTSGY